MVIGFSGISYRMNYQVTRALISVVGLLGKISDNSQYTIILQYFLYPVVILCK